MSKQQEVVTRESLERIIDGIKDKVEGGSFSSSAESMRTKMKIQTPKNTTRHSLAWLLRLSA